MLDKISKLRYADAKTTTCSRFDEIITKYKLEPPLPNTHWYTLDEVEEIIKLSRDIEAPLIDEFNRFNFLKIECEYEKLLKGELSIAPEWALIPRGCGFYNDNKDLTLLGDEIRLISSKYKAMYNRARPHQFILAYNKVPIADPNKITNSSYPSTTAVTGRFFYLYFKDKYPVLAKQLNFVQGLSMFYRVFLGYNFPSDIDAGVSLGDALYNYYKVNKLDISFKSTIIEKPRLAKV